MRARVLDAAGNATTSAPQTVRVDNTSPTIATVTSADSNGAVESGESLIVEMDEPLDPGGLPAASSLTFTRSSGGRTTMSIADLSYGSVVTGTSAWVMDGASITYSGVLTLTDGGRQVRFTVESCESGCGNAAAGDAGTLRFIPATSLHDWSGNSATGTKAPTLTLF